jgi:hypothetical protein
VFAFFNIFEMKEKQLSSHVSLVLLLSKLTTGTAVKGNFVFSQINVGSQTKVNFVTKRN